MVYSSSNYNQKVRDLTRQLHEVEQKASLFGGAFLLGKAGREDYADTIFAGFSKEKS